MGILVISFHSNPLAQCPNLLWSHIVSLLIWIWSLRQFGVHRYLLPALPWHSKSILKMKNVASLGLRLDPTFVLRQFITSICTDSSEINGKFKNLLEANKHLSVSHHVLRPVFTLLKTFAWHVLQLSLTFGALPFSISGSCYLFWKYSVLKEVLSSGIAFWRPRRFIQITKYCLPSQVQCGMGEVWIRKISLDPLDPGCLLAIVSSRSPRDSTLRSRLSHHNHLSLSQMNVQILFDILEAAGCEFLLLRSLLFSQAGTCQEHRQPNSN